MKSVSAAIVILAGALPFTSAGFIAHGDTSRTIGAIGLFVMAAGATAWVVEMIKSTPERP